MNNEQNDFTCHLDENVHTNVLNKVDSIYPCTTGCIHPCITLIFRAYILEHYSFLLRVYAQTYRLKSCDYRQNKGNGKPKNSPPPPDHEMLYTQGIPGVTATFIFLHLSTFHTFSKVSNETCVSVVNEPIKIYLKHLYIHICIQLQIFGISKQFPTTDTFNITIKRYVLIQQRRMQYSMFGSHTLNKKK